MKKLLLTLLIFPLSCTKLLQIAKLRREPPPTFAVLIQQTDSLHWPLIYSRIEAGEGDPFDNPPPYNEQQLPEAKILALRKTYDRLQSSLGLTDSAMYKRTYDSIMSHFVNSPAWDIGPEPSDTVCDWTFRLNVRAAQSMLYSNISASFADIHFPFTYRSELPIIHLLYANSFIGARQTRSQCQ